MCSIPHEAAVATGLTSIAVVPLAVHLLAGPGVMSTVVIAMQCSNAPCHRLLIVLSILLVALALWVVLSPKVPIGRGLGDIGLKILNCVFELILSVMAVEMIASGMKQRFPVLLS